MLRSKTYVCENIKIGVSTIIFPTGFASQGALNEEYVQMKPKFWRHLLKVPKAKPKVNKVL